MSSREEMLGRIRKALGTSLQPATVSQELQTLLENIMPPILPQELIAKFESELRAVSGQAYRASTLSALGSTLGKIFDATEARAVVISRNPLLGRLKIREKVEGMGKKAFAWPGNAEGDASPEESDFRKQCFAAEVGITGADFALAETGSLVLTSGTEGSQLASLAPPVHVALYRRDQVRASLDEVLAELTVSRDSAQASSGRSVVFITGVSRTADIEQSLVRGVHGPRELHVILIEEGCLDELAS